MLNEVRGSAVLLSILRASFWVEAVDDCGVDVNGCAVNRWNIERAKGSGMPFLLRRDIKYSECLRNEMYR